MRILLKTEGKSARFRKKSFNQREILWRYSSLRNMTWAIDFFYREGVILRLSLKIPIMPGQQGDEDGRTDQGCDR